MVGQMELECPEYPHEDSQPATLYVRPHELEVDRSHNGVASLEARVLHVNAAGAVTKLRLLAEEFGVVINVDLNPERYRELRVQPGDTVYVSPRRVRVFLPDYSI